jgi:hypothetical protein
MADASTNAHDTNDGAHAEALPGVRAVVPAQGSLARRIPPAAAS